MKIKLKKRIIIYSAIYLFVGLLLYFGQNKLVYFPTHPCSHNFTSITIDNENCKINVIVVNPDIQTNNAIIYFGGNAETVAYSAKYFQKHFPNHVTYLVNYRGYGLSTGYPSEKANYSDATKIFKFVVKEHPNVSIIGRSLGTGIATFLASTQEIAKLVLITPYDSIESIAQSKFFMYPMSFITTQKYLSIIRVKSIKCKCLALIAENDEMIAFKHSKALVDEFPKEQIKSIVLKGTGHNNISSSPNYFSLISDFIM